VAMYHQPFDATLAGQQRQVLPFRICTRQRSQNILLRFLGVRGT
jgi:hypothetical protein